LDEGFINQQPRRVIGEAFSSRSNSLNFLRLLFAVFVIVAHGVPLGGFGSGPILGRVPLGGIAVYGFFGISGFLIASSVTHNMIGRYLWQRILRIFPGFWVCLLVTAFGFGLLGWLIKGDPRGSACQVHCYFTGNVGAVDYMYHDLLLRMNQYQIAGGPRAVPYPLVWDGSLWTLFYEFVCYLILGGLSVLRVLRHRYFVVLATFGLWLTEALVAFRAISPNLNPDQTPILELTPIFLVGTLIYLFRNEIADSGLIALGCGAIYFAGLWWPLGGGTVVGSVLLAPILVYPVMWLGIHLPFQSVGSRNDYSYGVYIYAFPVQELLAVLGAQRLGFVPYVLLGIAGTAPFALGSWWLIEKQALKYKKVSVFPKSRTRGRPVLSG
jgi:peptidoglycan/LPS O-acetylase OafA/YrhL